MIVREASVVETAILNMFMYAWDVCLSVLDLHLQKFCSPRSDNYKRSYIIICSSLL